MLTSRLISKESHQPPKGDCEVFWQFDKCTLLSSQGSDAPAFRSLDRLRRATPILFFAVACRIGAFRSEPKQPDSVSRREIRCPALRLTASRGATSLSYSSCSACQIGAFRLKSKRPTMASHEENLCPADRLCPSRGNLYSLCSGLRGVKSGRARRACPVQPAAAWASPRVRRPDRARD